MKEQNICDISKSRKRFNYFLAIIFISGIAWILLYAGFESVDIELRREPNGVVNGQVVNSHVFGISKKNLRITGVKKAKYEYKLVVDGLRHHTESAVILSSDIQDVSLFDSLNADPWTKNKISSRVNSFLEDKDSSYYHEHFNTLLGGPL